MNRIEWKRKVRQVHRRTKIPTWAAICVMLAFIVAASAVVAAEVVTAKMDSFVREMHMKNEIQITETGEYPDWFVEWLNTEYLDGGRK